MTLSTHAVHVYIMFELLVMLCYVSYVSICESADIMHSTDCLSLATHRCNLLDLNIML